MDEEHKEIMRRLGNLETHIINLIIPIQNISSFMKEPAQLNMLLNLLSKPLQIDDSRLSNRLREFQDVMVKFELKVDALDKNCESLDITQTYSEIKYIANRLKAIEEHISKMVDKGLRKRIDLSFVCDGYELVKKPVGYDKETQVEEPYKDEDKMLNALKTHNEQVVIIHRFGLKNHIPKTLAKISEIIGVDRERVRQIESKALRNLRMKTNLPFVKIVKNAKLHKAVFGEILFEDDL